MFHNAHGCAAHAVSIRRNAFLAIFTSIELIFLNFKILKFSYQAFALHLICPMKVKLCWSVEHITSKCRLEKCQFNIGSNGTHSVLDTPDLWGNIVVYVTVEFPIDDYCEIRKESFKKCRLWKNFKKTFTENVIKQDCPRTMTRQVNSKSVLS